MNAKGVVFLSLIALLAASCGKETPPLPKVPQGGETVRLVVFGAEWCGECKADLPILQTALKARLGAAISRVNVELWVPTGKTPATPPTQAGADSYLKVVTLEGKAFPDGDPNKKPPRWPLFTELFPGVQKALPAAALYKANGEIYKRFAPGADSFHPADIVATVAEAVGN